MNRLLGIFLLILGSIAQAAGTYEPQLTKITESVYAVVGPLALPNERNRGFRNNAVIVLTSGGIVLCDPGGSAWGGEKVVALAQTLSDKPVVAVFNSHVHGDHWLGNEGVRRTYPEAVIYGHQQMKRRIEAGEGRQWLEQIERLTKGKAGGKVVVPPDRTLNDGDVIRIGDTQFRIYHTGAAHTDNDIMVEIVEQKTLFTGDVVRNGMLGLMESDSSFEGNIAAIDLLQTKELEHFIPGHGPVGGREITAIYRDYLETLLSRVKKLYADDLSDYEMKPKIERSLKAFSHWEGFYERFGAHISRAFLEVEEESF